MGDGWLVRFGGLLALGALASCGGPPLGCPRSCPVARVSLLVTDTAGVAVSTVDATLSSPTTEPQTLSCEPGADGTHCTSTGSASWLATSGSYSLRVTAPGFQTATVPATITAESSCGCQGATLDPAVLALDRS
jgi:hypothetical protein